MKKVFLLISITIAGSVLAQTKWISHKSHSGNHTTFLNALHNNLFDIGESNFGMAPRMRVCMAKLDTLEFLDDSTTVVKTSATMEYTPIFENTPGSAEMNEIQHLWKPGSDTVINHDLFIKKNSQATIRKVLKEKYNFKNDIDKMVIIDKSVKEYKDVKEKKNGTPIIIEDNTNGTDQNYWGGLIFILLSGITAIFVLVRSKMKSVS